MNNITAAQGEETMKPINLRARTSAKQSTKQAKVTEILVPTGVTIEAFVTQLNELAGFRKFVFLEEDQNVIAGSDTIHFVDPLDEAARIIEEAEAFIVEEDTMPMAEVKSIYTSDAYLAPTGPLVERPDYVIPNSFDDRAIAGRHGLQRFEVENAVNDGWLKR